MGGEPLPMTSLVESMVTTPQELETCIAHLNDMDVIALDTEFVGEDRYRPDLCLIQLATKEKLFLLDPLAIESLEPFWKVLTQGQKIILVHAGREEVRMCHFGISRTPSQLIDLQIVAGLLGCGYPVGYGGLVQQILHIRVHKGETLTDWRKRPLSDEQIQYAFDDVRYLIPLWEKLHHRLQKLNREDWAKEECDGFVSKAILDYRQTERWRKLSGINQLDRKRLAVVREMYAWREDQAAKLNRPVRFILRDDLLVEIAKRNPNKATDISSLRGLGKVDLDGILQAVHTARSLPPSQYPEIAERENDSPQISMIASLLNAILTDWCIKHHLTTSLVASSSDLKHLIRCQLDHIPLGNEFPLNRGWRRTHILPQLLGFLEGNRTIRIGNLRSEAPFVFEEVPSSEVK
jgi:ribonuclease D